jgi:hypothetical protein
MNDKEIAVFERMVKAQERIAAGIECQNAGKITQAIMIGAAVVTSLGIFNVIDIIIKWAGGK